MSQSLKLLVFSTVNACSLTVGRILFCSFANIFKSNIKFLAISRSNFSGQKKLRVGLIKKN